MPPSTHFPEAQTTRRTHADTLDKYRSNPDIPRQGIIPDHRPER
ncbi:hypothetical protein [Acaryochloris sp. 'Moss Beach']|nr:hypothetical protein [Acaryochloris sp. 'Moss Beach']